MRRVNFIKYFALLVVAICLVSCSDDSDGGIGDGDGGGLDDVVIQTDTETDDAAGSDSSQSVTPRVVKGLAADGKSKIVVAIGADSSNPAETILITSDVAWGTISGDETIKTINGSGYYLYTLTSQEDLPDALSSSSVAEIEFTIEATFADGSVKSATKSVEVVRPAVIFAHGLASSAETFDPMLSYIRATSLFVDSALFALDYSATSTASYNTNNRVIPDAIDECFEAMLEDGYVAAKATVIGHSMGGILTRIYLQDGVYSEDGATLEEPYREDILKMITIDTPHSGSQLADFAVELGASSSPLSIFSKMGAIVDLAVRSDATADLNDPAKLAVGNGYKVPTHVITAEIGTLSAIVDLVRDEQYVIAALSFLLDAVESKLLYGDDTSDIVVPMKSQTGGVTSTVLKKYITNYENEWHCSVHTTDSAAEDVVTLLNTLSSDSKSFTTDGFSPETLSYSENLTSGGSAVNIEEVTDFPFDGILKSIEIGLDGDEQIVWISYEGVNMGDDESVESIIEIARIESDDEETPHLIYMKRER